MEISLVTCDWPSLLICSNAQPIYTHTVGLVEGAIIVFAIVAFSILMRLNSIRRLAQ